MTYEETMAILDTDASNVCHNIITYHDNIPKAVSWVMNRTGCDQEIAERIVREVLDDLDIPEPTITAVHCPYCKSINVKKIGVVSRSMSVGMFGLGSGKIGKQWHCGSCGSDF